MAKNSVISEGAFDATARKKINDNLADVGRATADLTATSSTTLANVVGMVTDTLQPGTYRYRIHLSANSTVNGGVKLALKFGTASMLTSIENSSRAYTASGVAVTRVTTATDAASLVASTAAIINVVLEGTLVVAYSGTLQLQAAQNASHADTTTIYAGSYMEFVKIG